MRRSVGDLQDWPPSATAGHGDSVRPSAYLLWKQPLERAVGVLLLLLALPVITLLVSLVWATSPGPGIYRQRRVGKNGRIFSVYKIRSMRQDAEKGTGPVWSSQKRDPRVTPIGRWLRTLHLDELPQLFNVARGDMALIGPRPERPEFVEVLKAKIPGYVDRLAVVPGITGLAQVNLPADEALESVQMKVAADMEYIRNATPLMDAKILGSTVLRLFGKRVTWFTVPQEALRRIPSSQRAKVRQLTVGLKMGHESPPEPLDAPAP